MRRGLIAWSRSEVPASTLDARVARLQDAMGAERLAAVLVYSSFPRPAAVAWLTHFVPYWNEALLAVFPTGAPLLLASFSKRVHPWIREVSHVGEVRSAANLGVSAAEILREKLEQSGAPRVGVVELDALPWRVAESLTKERFALADASNMFTAIRQPADAIEIALATRAAAIASAAFAAIPGDARRASEVLAAVERRARLDGAEDLIARLAPDLAASPTLLRFEGDAALGERYALEITLAYKGTTIRLAKCVARDATPQSWVEATRWFATLSGDDPPRHAPGKLRAWRLEACLGGEPLSVVRADAEPAHRALPPGALAVLSLRLDLRDGPWYTSVPLILGGRRLA